MHNDGKRCSWQGEQASSTSEHTAKRISLFGTKSSRLLAMWWSHRCSRTSPAGNLHAASHSQEFSNKHKCTKAWRLHSPPRHERSCRPPPAAATLELLCLICAAPVCGLPLCLCQALPQCLPAGMHTQQGLPPAVQTRTPCRPETLPESARSAGSRGCREPPQSPNAARTAGDTAAPVQPAQAQMCCDIMARDTHEYAWTCSLTHARAVAQLIPMHSCMTCKHSGETGCRGKF